VALANPAQVKDAIAAVSEHMGIGLKPQIAYVLATAEWETAHLLSAMSSGLRRPADQSDKSQ
jgi:hypothetical protein